MTAKEMLDKVQADGRLNGIIFGIDRKGHMIDVAGMGCAACGYQEAKRILSEYGFQFSGALCFFEGEYTPEPAPAQRPLTPEELAEMWNDDTFRFDPAVIAARKQIYGA